MNSLQFIDTVCSFRFYSRPRTRTRTPHPHPAQRQPNMATVNHVILTQRFYPDSISITIYRSTTHHDETFIEIRNSDGTKLPLWINHRARESDILRLHPDYVAHAHDHNHYIPCRELFPIRSQWCLEWPDGEDMPRLRNVDTGIVRNLVSSNGRIGVIVEN
jgi:hypothetical protein